MPALKTEISEIVTGAAMAGGANLERTLATPPAITNVGDKTWHRIRTAWVEGEHTELFEQSWENGVVFLEARDGLRHRKPNRIEWKGPHKPPGYESVPADLRIDHVFLVSCKYLSRILINSSPSHLFERALAVKRGPPARDWYNEVAPVEYQELYQSIVSAYSISGVPSRVTDLEVEHRSNLKSSVVGGLMKEVLPVYRRFSSAVSAESASRWRSAIDGGPGDEEMLWRILRLEGAPYFVLGSAPSDVLRLRIGTPWDWRQTFELEEFQVKPVSAGQPKVEWIASVRDRALNSTRVVTGHVEIRWSHGRFYQAPEAKVYLDTPHRDVPGYFALN